MARVLLEVPFFYTGLAMTKIFAGNPRVTLESKETFFLEGTAIDTAIASGNSPIQVAQTLLDQMNVVVRAQLKWPHPLHTSSSHLTREWEGWSFPGAQVRIAAVLAVSGLPDSFAPDNETAEHVITVAAREERVARALRFLYGTAGVPDWFDIYKVVEIIRHDIPIKQLHQAWPNLRTVLEEAANRHEVTGDRARHAELPGAWSGRTISRSEAVDVVEAITMHWIKQM